MACMHCLILTMFEARTQGEAAEFIEEVGRGLAQIAALIAAPGKEQGLLQTVTAQITSEFNDALKNIEEIRAGNATETHKH